MFVYQQVEEVCYCVVCDFVMVCVMYLGLFGFVYWVQVCVDEFCYLCGVFKEVL